MSGIDALTKAAKIAKDEGVELEFSIKGNDKAGQTGKPDNENKKDKKKDKGVETKG